MAQLFVLSQHIPEIEKYLKFGRDLYRYGVLVVFCDNWRMPKEYKQFVVQHLIIDVPNVNCNCD